MWVPLGGKAGHFPTGPSTGLRMSSPDSVCPGCRHSYLPTPELRAEGKWEPVGKQQASPRERVLGRGLAHTSLRALDQRCWREATWDGALQHLE